MTQRRIPIAFFALALVLTLASGPIAVGAGDFQSQAVFGSNFFLSSPPCPVNQFPPLETVVPVSALIDPFEQDFIPIFCEIEVFDGERGVKKAKGTFESEIIVRDNDTGEVESFPVGSGRFRTGSNGRDTFDFDLPSELFADGFESGDVSAWSYTRTSFTNKKKAEQAAVHCNTSASHSGN